MNDKLDYLIALSSRENETNILVNRCDLLKLLMELKKYRENDSREMIEQRESENDLLNLRWR